jgi:hypothetical protein
MERLVDRKPPLRFGERMRREHKYDGFMSIIVDGKQRIGKSSYEPKRSRSPRRAQIDSKA